MEQSHSVEVPAGSALGAFRPHHSTPTTTT
jgi:hypothetical protein